MGPTFGRSGAKGWAHGPFLAAGIEDIMNRVLLVFAIALPVALLSWSQTTGRGESGKPLYTGGGTYILNGTSYTEHVDFAIDKIAAGLVGKEQSFTVRVDGDTFTQTGTNGKALSEAWKRVN